MVSRVTERIIFILREIFSEEISLSDQLIWEIPIWICRTGLKGFYGLMEKIWEDIGILDLNRDYIVQVFGYIEGII